MKHIENVTGIRGTVLAGLDHIQIGSSVFSLMFPLCKLALVVVFLKVLYQSCVPSTHCVHYQDNYLGSSIFHIWKTDSTTYTYIGEYTVLPGRTG